jgi:glucose-1-phosphate adenylyltransferase
VKSVITVILAGGVGSRLAPLTDPCTKPAVEIAAKYRIIDFMMSNCLNSGLHHILVATQYRSHELSEHLADNYPSNAMHGFFVRTVPAQQLHGEMWYQGTANAIYQNLGIIASEGDFQSIAILSGDHVLAMHFGQMHAYHLAKQSAFTVCVMPVPVAEASRFGVLEVDSDWRIIGFEEKPDHPKEIPGRSGYSLVSMGNYFAELESLSEWLTRDATRPDTSHDFGKDIIPGMLAAGASLYAYNFLDNAIPGQSEHYWRDVGTIEALHAANLDLVRIKPELNLYNKEWPIRSAQDNLPPAKFNQTASGDFRPTNSVVSGGCIIEDALLVHSVLGREVRVYGSSIEDSVLFTGVKVKHGCQLRRVIVDKGVRIPERTSIGFDHAADRARGLTVDESGIVVVPRGFRF